MKIAPGPCVPLLLVALGAACATPPPPPLPAPGAAPPPAAPPVTEVAPEPPRPADHLGGRAELQLDHTDGLEAVRWVADSGLVITAARDGSIKVRSRDRVMLRTLQTGFDLSRAAISADGSVVVASEYTTAGVWWTGRARALPLPPHPATIMALAASHDGGRVATGDATGVVRLFDIVAGTECDSAPLGSNIADLAFTPDGETMAVALAGGDLAILQAADASLRRRFPAGLNEYARLAVAPDGNRLVAAAYVYGPPAEPKGNAISARVWDLHGQKLATLPGPPVREIAYSAGGTVIAGVDGDRIWRWRSNGTALPALLARTGERFNAALLDLSADGELCLTASTDLPALRIHDAANRLVADLSLPSPPWITSVAFAPDSGRVIVGQWDGHARIWSASGTLLATLGGSGHTVDSVAWSPTGQLVALSRDEVELWSPAGKLLRRLGRHQHGAGALAFSADGGRVFSGGGDSEIAIHEVSSGKQVRRFRAHSDRVYSLALSPDGRMLVSGSPFGELKRWTTEGTLVSQNRDHGEFAFVYALAFSPSGNRWASAGGGMVKVWDRDGTLLQTLPIPAHQMSNTGGVALAPDDDRVAAVINREIYVWPMSSGPALALSGHNDDIYALAWSGDGQLLVSGGRDGGTRIWHLGSGALLQLYAAGDEWVSVTAEGLWTSSPGGRALLRWVEGLVPSLEAAPLDALHRASLLAPALERGLPEPKRPP